MAGLAPAAGGVLGVVLIVVPAGDFVVAGPGARDGAIRGRPLGLGDLLFATANWARHQGVDPEESLRLANAKFERRFRAMEDLARQRGLVLKALSAEAWDALWNEVKSAEKQAGKP